MFYNACVWRVLMRYYTTLDFKFKNKTKMKDRVLALVNRIFKEADKKTK